MNPPNDNSGLAAGMTELLPCPFCGGEAAVGLFRSSIMNRNWQADCVNPECACSVSTCALETMEEAITAWNTRADLSRPHGSDALQIPEWLRVVWRMFLEGALEPKFSDTAQSHHLVVWLDVSKEIAKNRDEWMANNCPDIFSSPAPGNANKPQGSEDALTKNQRFVLEWLKKDDGQYGECKGKDLDRLMELGFAEWARRDVRGDDYGYIAITEKGVAALSTPSIARTGDALDDGWKPIDSAFIKGPVNGKGNFLVTNNINARNAHGKMSHVWTDFLVHENPKGSHGIEGLYFCLGGPYSLTHYKEIEVPNER
jgi:hypothetical protein